MAVELFLVKSQEGAPHPRSHLGPPRPSSRLRRLRAGGAATRPPPKVLDPWLVPFSTRNSTKERSDEGEFPLMGMGNLPATTCSLGDCNGAHRPRILRGRPEALRGAGITFVSGFCPCRWPRLRGLEEG